MRTAFVLVIATFTALNLSAAGIAFNVGTNPEGVCFDGTNIWVTNFGSNNVTELRAVDGTVLGTFAVGSGPKGVASDGTNIWVANYNDGTLTKLRASDGTFLGTVTVGQNPWGVAFDGANVWVANNFSNTVTKVRTSDGANLGSFNVGMAPIGVVYDGSANVWVANTASNTVSKLRTSDGGLLGTFQIGSGGLCGSPGKPACPIPYGLASDGTNIWVSDKGSNTVTELQGSTGGLVGTFSVGNGPTGVAFDGTNIWVANNTDGTVTKLQGSTGTVLGTLAVGANPLGEVFDGSNIWVANFSANTVSKLRITLPQGLPQHPSAAGIFRSANGLWLLDSNFNNTFDSGDTVTLFAGAGLTPLPGDIPVAGDWSGSGTTKIGLYRPSSGTWFLDYNGNGSFDGPTVDRQYQYGGLTGDIPIVGDWNGSGASKIGIFRSGFLFLLNVSGSGVFGSSDHVFGFGGATGCTGPLPGFFNSEPVGSCDIPVTGDWNNSGITKVGVVRAGPGTSQPFLWILDTTGAQQVILPGAGVTNPSTIFAFGGIQGDVPIVGDWTNSGTAKVGVFRSGFFWVEDTTASLPTPPAASDTLAAFAYGGISGDMPVVGRWK